MRRFNDTVQHIKSTLLYLGWVLTLGSNNGSIRAHATSMSTKGDNAIKEEDKNLVEQVDVKGDASLQNIAKDETEQSTSSLELNDVKGDISLQVRPKSKTGEYNPGAMSKVIEPPTFISEEKSYAEYKHDLKSWSRFCGIDKKLQAEIVVYKFEGHPSRIKEKINTQIGEKLEDNENGIAELIKFLDGIYTKDDMAEAWEKFRTFSDLHRKPEQSMSEFISEWENCYFKMKKASCEYSDIILAFKLLSDSKLNEIETKLVLTGVDYKTGKETKNLLEQVKESLKKFKGRPAVLEDSRSVQVSDTLVAEMEEVFLSKGWKPPAKKQRRRSRSLSPPRTQPNNKNANYKGRKNALGSDRMPRKCFKCRCNCVENCNCPCVYHFANECTATKKTSDDKLTKTPQESNKSLLGLYIESNIQSKQEPVLLVEGVDEMLPTKVRVIPTVI